GGGARLFPLRQGLVRRENVHALVFGGVVADWLKHANSSYPCPVHEGRVLKMQEAVNNSFLPGGSKMVDLEFEIARAAGRWVCKYTCAAKQQEQHNEKVFFHWVG